MRIKRGILGLGIASAAAAALAGAAPPGSFALALNDPRRPAAQVELDAWRKPAEVMAFAGVKPGDRIADFMPGNAYFTRLFSGVVGPHGRVYAYLPTEQLAHCAPDEVAGTQAIERDPSYSNVSVLRGSADDFAAPGPLDMVWTAQDYHDLHDAFMAPTHVDRFNAAVFRALKHGGIYLIIDHVAESGSGLRDTDTLHRIDPESIRTEVTAAGFVFESQSDVLRNAGDDHHLAIFDPAIRHHTDQIVFKFRKP